MQALVPSRSQTLTTKDFHTLAEVPPELEWWANFSNPKTQRAYRLDIQDFMAFAGIASPHDMRSVNRAHVIAWRTSLEQRLSAPATIRRKLAALASLFDYLCEHNAVAHNPVAGVKRPRSQSGQGLTPTISDEEARASIEKPNPKTLKGKRDRAILATYLFHAVRREELVNLKVEDRHARGGVPHLRIHGKGGKLRFIPLHPQAQRLMEEYLEECGHGEDNKGPLFRPVRNRTNGILDKHLHVNSLYDIVKEYTGVGNHALRKTSATNALSNDADIAKVRDWLGHADISTTQIYDGRTFRAEDSPTFRVKF